jgi:hypothetical protein
MLYFSIRKEGEYKPINAIDGHEEEWVIVRIVCYIDNKWILDPPTNKITEDCKMWIYDSMALSRLPWDVATAV